MNANLIVFYLPAKDWIKETLLYKNLTEFLDKIDNCYIVRAIQNTRERKVKYAISEIDQPMEYDELHKAQSLPMLDERLLDLIMLHAALGLSLNSLQDYRSK